MLHILLLVLKIIGIILGILLGVTLLALLLVLFVPVHYQMEAVRIEGEGNPPIEIKAKLSWLFHLIHVRILYPAEVYLKVRVFLFTVFRMPPKQEKTHKSERKTRKKNGNHNKDRNAPEKKGRAGSENNTNQKDNNNEEINNSNINDNHRNNEATDSKTRSDTEKSGGEKGNKISSDAASDTTKRKVKFSLKAKLRKIWEFFQNIWYTIKKICDKIRKILENIEYYWNVLQSDTFKQSYSLCKEELGAVFNYIKPRKFKADLVVGMDDPTATGQILSYYGILYPLIGNHVTIVGDFEQKKIEGSVFIKGRVKLFTILKAAKRIYFSKDIRKLLKLFKKEDV